jgi:hypothetical protein
MAMGEKALSSVEDWLLSQTRERDWLTSNATPKVQNWGLVPNGIGGGASSPASVNPGFFAGGGGAGFFFPSSEEAPDKAFAALDALEGRSAPAAPGPWPALPPVPLILPAMPYLSFRAPACLAPAATWSPCRWRKLFIVEAAARASVMDTELGSLRKLDAVCSAACFWAKVVPSEGAAGALGEAAPAFAFVVPRRAKRDCSSFSCWLLLASTCARAEGDEGLSAAAPDGLWMPNAGTEIPAAPNRFAAPSFR